MAALTWLEATGLSRWVRESPSLWAFPTILTLHTFGLGLLVGASTVVNLRLLGIGRRMPMAPLSALFNVMWIGLAINAITGSLLFAADATARGTSLLFLAKLVCVAFGIATIVLIKRTVFDDPAGDTASVAAGRRLAVLSLLAWTAAITSGRLLAYL